MVQQKRKTGHKSMLGNVVIGFVAMLVIATVLIAVSATLISGEHIGYDSLDYIAPIINFIAVFIGCFLTGRLMTEKKALSCGVVTAVYFVATIGIGILFFNGISGRLILGLAACAMGSVAAILLCAKNKQGSRRKTRVKSRR